VKELIKVLCDNEDVTRHTAASVGENKQWISIVNISDENRQNFCKALNWKTRFSALYGIYTFTLQELQALLKGSSAAGKSETTNCTASQKDGLKEVRRRKRYNTNETTPT
jgi:hypothetical protein